MRRKTEGEKEEKYWEKEKVYFGLEIKVREIFGEEKCFWRRKNREKKEESIWRRKIFSK